MALTDADIAQQFNTQVTGLEQQYGIGDVYGSQYNAVWDELYSQLAAYGQYYPELSQWLELFRQNREQAFSGAGIALLHSNPQIVAAFEQSWRQVQAMPEWATFQAQYPEYAAWVGGYVGRVVNGTSDTSQPGMSPTDLSARATLNSVLQTFGLESLGTFVWQEYLNGVPIEQIMLDIRNRPEYKMRFPAMEKLAREGHAISEAEYINYEQSAIGIMRAASMPPGFYDNPADFQALLEGHVSIAELQSRVMEEYVRVAHTAPEIRQYFTEMFGASGDAALAAIYLDPERALGALHNMTSAAAFGGISRIAGEGVGFETAMTAAQAGIGESAARQGFQNVAQLHPLELGTIGEGTGLTPDELAAGVFGLGPGSEQLVRRRMEERAAEFAGSQGGPLETSLGALGLGTSSRAVRR